MQMLLTAIVVFAVILWRKNITINNRSVYVETSRLFR